MKKRSFIFILFSISFICFSQETPQTGNIDPMYLVPRSHVVFHIEGDFTNSGFVEKVFFYKSDNIIVKGIHRAYCVLFNGENKAVKAYRIPYYGTMPFDREYNLLSMPAMEKLGRNIVWEGYSIGRIGDFNSNGREELYFFSLDGIGFYPIAYEFNPKSEKFEIIIGEKYTSFFRVLKVDKEQKKIILEASGTAKKLIYLQWDETTKLYIDFQPNAEEQKEAKELMNTPPIRTEPGRQPGHKF